MGTPPTARVCSGRFGKVARVTKMSAHCRHVASIASVMNTVHAVCGAHTYTSVGRGPNPIVIPASDRFAGTWISPGHIGNGSGAASHWTISNDGNVPLQSSNARFHAQVPEPVQLVSVDGRSARSGLSRNRW